MSEYTYKITSLNINGIAATTSIKMLEDFIQTHEIDLISLQGVTNTNINIIRNYSAHKNRIRRQEYCFLNKGLLHTY
jgi:exonuclease III